MLLYLPVALRNSAQLKHLKSKLGETVKGLGMTLRYPSVGIKLTLLEIEYENMGKTTVDFSYPNSVSSMRVILKDETCCLEFSDMKFECEKGILKGSVPETMVSVISDLLLNNEKIEAYRQNGETVRENTWYTVYQNSENGFITKIVTSEFTINFTQKQTRKAST